MSMSERGSGGDFVYSFQRSIERALQPEIPAWFAEYKRKPIIDRETGIIFNPFLSSDAQVEFATACEMELDPEEFYQYSPNSSQIETIIRRHYYEVVDKPLNAKYEIIDPKRGRICLTGAAFPNDKERSVWTSILIAKSAQRSGYATFSMAMLYSCLKQSGVQTAYAKIADQNDASRMVHERFTRDWEPMTGARGWLKYRTNLKNFQTPDTVTAYMP